MPRCHQPHGRVHLAAVAADLVCITVLTFGLYHRRHGRRDLLLAYLALNTGVLAVTLTLTSVQASIGLGLGLFGILSIIRLRSDQIAQEEIAYYFTSLALGLLAGLHPDPAWLAPTASVALVALVGVADHPALLRRSGRVVLTLDRAYPVESAARTAAAATLDAELRRIVILEVDLVRDVTVADVRYRLPSARTQQTEGRGAADKLGAAPPWPAPQTSAAPAGLVETGSHP